MEWNLELSRADAKSALKDMQARAVHADHDFLDGKEVSGKLQVNFRGRWLDLCRTDDMDDVCTSEAMTIKEAESRVPKAIEWAVKHCRYGARINDDTFAAIDQISDG